MLVEDAQLLHLSPDSSAVWEGIVHGPARPAWDIPAEFEAPPAGYDNIMKVTVRSAMKASASHAYEMDVTIESQLGQQEFAVAALIIWSTTPAAHYLLPRLPIHRIPLALWGVHLKEWLTMVRLLGRVDGGLEDQRYIAWKYRRLMALSGRTMEEADWEKERFDRTSRCVPKYAADPATNSLTRAAYRTIRTKTLAALAGKAVAALKDRPGDLWSWWARRARNTPSGSSSRHKDLKAVVTGKPGVDLEMRPTKKAVIEVFTEDDLKAWLCMTPRCIARTSTKHEPARKNRALFAQDDEGATIAAYASEGMERTMKTDGMILSQMPEDVKEWIAAETQHDYKVSNDYSNFNILHSPGDLAAVSWALAKAWLQLYKRTGSRKAVHKATCEAWTAESYKRMFAVGKETYRVTCGLYSGHRNTARDNTLLHRVYLNCIHSISSLLLGSTERVNFERMSGDDEITHFRSWSRAVLHPLIADGAGFKSKVEKGLLSMDNDEFLQLMRHPGNVPTYPVAHTILTFCSGNWYKTPVRDLASTIPAIEDHAWDLVLGEVPLPVAQKLAAGCLDYLMQIKLDGDLLPMEWWKYRGTYEHGGHPLWGYTQGELPPDVVPETSVRLSEDMPTNAETELMATEKKYWDLDRTNLQKEVLAERLQTAYASIMRHSLTKGYDEAAAKAWERRADTKTLIPAELRTPTILADATVNRRLRAYKLEREPPSPFAICIRYAVPPELFKRNPSLVLSRAEPRARAELLAAMRAPEMIRGKEWTLPGLLRTAV